MALACACRSVGRCGPVTALAGVPEDEAGLAVVQVRVSSETLEVGALIGRVLIQTIGAAEAEVFGGVPGGGGRFGGGGLWGKACILPRGERRKGK